MIALTPHSIDTQALLESVQSPHAGAVVLFLGTVRDLTGDQVTEFLEYEAYPPMAEKKLAELATLARQRWPIQGLAMVHRIGRLGVGEVSVAVAVSCPHRVEAFEAGRFLIDTLKEQVPIWKKDTAPDGAATWVKGHTPGGDQP
jgi:molybdopterin synthase catalytic subunit